MEDDIRKVLHDVLNTLAVSHGMAKVIERDINGVKSLSEDERKIKIEKVILNIDKTVELVKDLRAKLIAKN